MIQKTIKMIKNIFFFFLLAISSINLNAQTSYQLPKVLILTTGDGAGRGTVSDGVVLALQSFNKMGVFVRLENRSALLKPDLLAEYSILIIPTIPGYHDKPYKNALTYMSDMEMQNINDWVKNGGTLLTDVNAGRNTLKKYDRVLNDGVLDQADWLLAKSFGVKLKEVNISSFVLKDNNLHIWNNKISIPNKMGKWLLVPIKTESNIEAPMQWKNGNSNLHALTVHPYGKGKVIMLPTFYLLHPKKDAGLSTEKQIDRFYKFVYNQSIGNHQYTIQLLPWKDAHTSAYCQTFDDGGNMEQYQRIIHFTNQNKLPTVFFVTPHINTATIKLLKSAPYISIQGHSFNHPDFRKLNFSETENEFLMNRLFWKKKFMGFRFPYVSNSFWGMYSMNKLDFKYDTSIAANHLEFIRGSVVPYNIPIFKDDFYQTLDLFEISQIYHSDWFFYQKVLEKAPYTEAQQKLDADRFRKYLFRYFSEVVQPNNGVMVYLGHPMYSGISDTTLQPLKDFLAYIKEQNVWITSLNTVAERWNKLKNLNVQIEENNRTVKIFLDTHGEKIEGLSIKLSQKPTKITCDTKYKLKRMGEAYYLILDVNRKNVITLHY